MLRIATVLAALVPFVVSSSVSANYVEVDTLAPADAALWFGAFQISVSGDLAVIGSQRDDEAASVAGAAYVFERVGDSWVQRAKLMASDASANAGFGSAVAIDGNTIVIGAPKASSSGRVYVFTGAGSSWTERAILDSGSSAFNLRFGSALDLDGDTLIVGAIGYATDSRGAAYVFVGSDDTWGQQGQFIGRAASNGNFGFSVAVEGDTALVGAWQDRSASPAGAAYVWGRSNGVWTERQQLLPSDGAGNDKFGIVVALSGSTAMVGASWKSATDATTGAAYGFTYTGTVWEEEQRLTASDAVVDDRFGSPICLDGDRAWIGAPRVDEASPDGGAIYPLLRMGSVWSEEERVLPTSAPSGTSFGSSMARVHDGLLVGGLGREVYFLKEVTPMTDGPCTIAEQCTSGHCVDGVCCDVECGGGMDDCQSCVTGTCLLEAMDTPCRASAGECDSVEQCDGLAAACPEDEFATAGASCGDPTVSACDLADRCDGFGACLPAEVPDGSACVSVTYCLAGGLCLAGECQGGALPTCSTDEKCDEEADTCYLACSDAVLDAGEECDEGAANSDTAPNACRTTCTLASCGDGVRDAGEACDNGEDNADEPGATCRADCSPSGCGDGVVDADEECDEGAANANLPGAPCRTTCVRPSCGDGVVDAALGEACDDGPSNSSTRADACRPTCGIARCGDGVVDSDEACDDGVSNDDQRPDACRSSCAMAFCGDHVVDSGEACDGTPGCSSSCAIGTDAGVSGPAPAPMGGCATSRGADLSYWTLALIALVICRRRS